jgi:DNA-binding response OmpR family regulator
MMQLILRNEGFDVICPENPGDSLTLAKEEYFDAYVLDNVMPEMTGKEICQRIGLF